MIHFILSGGCGVRWCFVRSHTWALARGRTASAPRHRSRCRRGCALCSARPRGPLAVEKCRLLAEVRFEVSDFKLQHDLNGGSRTNLAGVLGLMMRHWPRSAVGPWRGPWHSAIFTHPMSDSSLTTTVNALWGRTFQHEFEIRPCMFNVIMSVLWCCVVCNHTRRSEDGISATWEKQSLHAWRDIFDQL